MKSLNKKELNAVAGAVADVFSLPIQNYVCEIKTGTPSDLGQTIYKFTSKRNVILGSYTAANARSQTIENNFLDMVRGFNEANKGSMLMICQKIQSTASVSAYY